MRPFVANMAQPQGTWAGNVALRAALLRPVLLGTAALALAYLVAGAAGVARSRLFPWDGLWLLAVGGSCGWLLRRGHAPWAASFFLAGVSQPFFYASQSYGVSHPVNAVFLLGILLSGLVIGGWFLGLWVAGYCLWMAGAAWGEWAGEWGPPTPVRDPAALLRIVGFWWATFAATGWLVWLFASTLEGAVQLARGQTAALARTVNALAAAPDLDTVTGQVLRAVAEPLGARWATLWLHDVASDTLAAQAVFADGQVRAGDPDGLAPNRTPAREVPLWGELQQTRRPVLVTDISNDPRLRHRARLLAQGVQTILHLPLLLGDEVVGSLSLQSPERRRYRADELELAQALAQQLTLAMHLTRLSGQAQGAAVTEERNRMAREIHDTLAQGFTGIVVQLEAAEDALAEAPTEAQAHLVRARALARGSLAEARRSVWALRPQALEGGDLPAALTALARQTTEGGALRVRFQREGAPRPLAPDVESHALRIAQEVVTNALRHAGATTATITLAFEPAALRLCIHDDGRGFDPARANGGFGLRGMSERAAQLGGTLSVTSAPGAGTTVEVEVPLKVEGF